MTHQLDIKFAGTPLEQADKALIMIHGRGGSAADILGLAPHFNIDGYALVAPQASNNTWYPQSFMAPTAQNEPWLGSALDTVERTVQQVEAAGIAPENIYFFGFSQGACLSLEFLARHARRYGGAVAIIGGLLGAEINRENYQGDFGQTPIFIGTSNPDFHVPVERVYESKDILAQMNAAVTLQVHENFGHSINQEEIDLANTIIFK